MNGDWPSSLVDQNFLPVSLTMPVAWTVTVLPFDTTSPAPSLSTCRMAAGPSSVSLLAWRPWGEWRTS